MDAEPGRDPRDFHGREAEDAYFLRYGWPWFPVVDANARLVGVVSREALESVPEALRASRPVGSVMARDDGESGLRIGLEEPLESLLGQEGLARSGRSPSIGTAFCAAWSRSTRCVAHCAATGRPPRGAPLHRIAAASRMPQHDVLVIGAGLAGQRRPRRRGGGGIRGHHLQGPPVRSHSNAAQGGINAALDPQDSWESHAFDTVKGSDYLGDQDAIEIMCREAPNELLTLEHLGATFHRNEEGRLGKRAFGGPPAAPTTWPTSPGRRSCTCSTSS